MTIDEDIAIKIAQWLEDAGYMRKGTRHTHPEIVVTLAKISADVRAADLTQQAHFVSWWADKVHHRYHPTGKTAAPFAPNDFRHCNDSLCLSMLGTVTELTEAGAKLAPDRPADAPPPLS